MPRRTEPSLILSIAALIAISMGTVVLFFAIQQPWMGLSLTVQDKQIVITQVQGPAQAVPVGATLEKVSAQGQEIWLEALDLALEPDGTMGSYATYRRFLDRQNSLSQMLRHDTVQLRLGNGNTAQINPEHQRPLHTLPVAFWVQLAVGVFAWLISASVFAFRQTEKSAQYLLLSGAATLVFSSFAGLYSTRELALPAPLFQWLNDLNFFGGSIFVACFIALLLHYPRRIGPRWLAPAVVMISIAWFIAQQFGMFESMTFARRFLVMVGTFITFALAGWHWHLSRRDPTTRAALQWFLLSWVVGTGLFTLFILLPQLFGIDTSALQGYAFLLFLLVYGGLASGILRYRLFELDRWWAGALLWLFVALLLIGLDFLFLFMLHLSSELSLALALLICGVIWLPLRGLIWRQLFNKQDADARLAYFRQVTDIALAPPGANQLARWHALLSSVFRPLHIEPGSNTNTAALEEEGLALLIPSADGLPNLRLTYADGGRRLFSPRDRELAQELVDMLNASAKSRTAYEQGVLTERGRIARDLHDNIGAQLMIALHSPTSENKDTVIRDTIQGLRSIIDDSAAQASTWQEALADLRQETADRLHTAGLKLDWQETPDLLSAPLTTPALHTLRSILREAVTNTLRHAQASTMAIRIVERHGHLHLSIQDNGKGLEHPLSQQGNGLANMQSRVTALAGRIELSDASPGLHLSVDIPL